MSQPKSLNSTEPNNLKEFPSNPIPPNSERLFDTSRRQFLHLIALGSIGWLAKELSYPAAARADSEVPPESTSEEIYHIFVGNNTARQGGTQRVTFKTGESIEIPVPANSVEGSSILVKNRSMHGGDAIVILHTLFDKNLDIDGKVENAIATAAIKPSSQERCRAVYQQIVSAQYTEDTAAQKLLDFLVASSPLDADSDIDSKIRQRYQIASQNSRLVKIENCIEAAISVSQLAEADKKLLRSTFQYVRASESLPNVSYLPHLTSLDTIIQSSTLSTTLKQIYSLSSAKTRAFTVDEVILELIKTDKFLSEDDKQKYLEIYNQVRNGYEVKDQYTLGSLDTLVSRSNIIEECKTVYRLARNRFFAKDEQTATADLRSIVNTAKSAKNAATGFVSTATQFFSATGVASGTGTAISSLTGAAATNATLAALGGGSVAAGGFGMLGGLALATGGAALIGAAALVSVALVSEMDAEDYKNLGIATFAGALTSAATMGTAWAVLSTFGAASSLSGAAAISATMAALGGVSVMTGGTALIAFGVGLGVWQILQGHKDETKQVLQSLEPLLYTLVDRPNSGLMANLQKYLAENTEGYSNAVYLAPEIPLKKLSNALGNYAFVDTEERVLAVIELGLFGMGDAQDGMAFTNQGIWWKEPFSSSNSVKYSDSDYLFKIKHLPEPNSVEEKRNLYSLAVKLGQN